MPVFLRQMNIGSRLAIVITLVMILAFTGFGLGLSLASERLLRDQTRTAMQEQIDQFRQTVALFDRSLQQQAVRFLTLFEGEMLSPPLVLDERRSVTVGREPTPVLMDQQGALNLDRERVDAFTRRTDTPVTVFARRGDDFVRVTTSLENERGERAMGTLLDRQSRAFKALERGESYSGIATLFDTPYITRYEPLFDEEGRVVGASFIGVDITADLAALRERVEAMRVGENGFFMIVDQVSGDVVAGQSPGDGPLRELQDERGQSVLASLLASPEGTLEYVPADGDRGGLTTLFNHYPDWRWVLAATAVDRDVEQLVNANRNRFLLGALVLALLVGSGLYLLIRRAVSKPLAEAQTMAGHLAAGDLGYRLETRRQDEVGALIASMNGVSDGLRDIVGRVRQSVDGIEHAAREINSGNLDLSRRTESQAASLEESAASIEELTATVRQNHERTRQGDSMASDVTQSAREGRQRLETASVTMKDLEGTASKMSAIIETIDAIAFQTNLLALNASVEAARAGVHGRGFTVVAEEVRRLANRCSNASADIAGLIRHTVAEVESGGAHIRESREKIEEIVTRIERLGVVIGEISQASSEQLSGIEQISVALSSLDDTTQHNAALVEQSAAASGHLDDQAGHLANTVSVFRLPGALTSSV